MIGDGCMPLMHAVAFPQGDSLLAPRDVSALRTTRAFASYLSAGVRIGPHAAVAGDGCLKVLQALSTTIMTFAALASMPIVN